MKAVATLISAVAPEAARLFLAILAVRGASTQTVDALQTAALAWPQSEPAAALDLIMAANRQAVDELDIDLVVFGRRSRDTTSPRSFGESRPRLDEESGPAPPAGPLAVRLSGTLLAILDEQPLDGSTRATCPEFDAQARRWRAVVEHMICDGEGGHLALRMDPTRDSSEAVTAWLGRRLRIQHLNATGALAASILQIELHAGGQPPLILVRAPALVLPADTIEPVDLLDAPLPAPPSPSPAPFVDRAARWLDHVRAVYLWPVSDRDRIEIGRVPFIGAAIGPFAQDATWVRRSFAECLGTRPDSEAVRVMMTRVVDPRHAPPVVRVARAVSQTLSLDLANACAMATDAFVNEPAELPTVPLDFDARLLVCDPEALQLLDQASVLAENGCRMLCWGPPGGGKSSFARVLANNMAAGRTVRLVTPADILARQWGGMERLVRNLWSRAADQGEVLVIDEFEVICGRRNDGAPSGNALLVRALTDEFLRNLDEFPQVPLLATVNDLQAVDAAARRRFAFLLHFGAGLSADQERLAWDRILGCKPPRAWKACGAAIADIDLARSQCRMLGTKDAQSLARAITRARDARLGRQAEPKRKTRSTVH